MTSTQQRVALITGCSSGIGLLTAVEMAAAGFRVIATMRDPSRQDRLMQAAQAAGAGSRLEVRRLDITETARLPQAVDEILSSHGRIDVLVNNAGFALGGFAEDIQLEELRDQFETNFFGQVALTRAVLPAMRRQQSGHIIMVSSISGLAATPVTSSYGASKFALEGWSEALRIELRALGIRVVLIEPGAFATDIWEKNVKMGKAAMSPDSPNRERSKRFAEMVRTRVAKGDARKVARLIVSVANDPRPRLRYRIGRDANMHYRMKALLPWKLYERLVARMTAIDG